MASLTRFAVTDLIVIGPGALPIIQVITDVSCTLTMHSTITPPLSAQVTRSRRGRRALLDLRWYLSSLTSLAQDQPADTTSHSFTIPPVPDGSTLYFHFTATFLGVPAVSGTAIFQYSDGGYEMSWQTKAINYPFESLDGYSLAACTGLATVTLGPAGPRFDTGPNPGDLAKLRDSARNYNHKPSNSHAFLRVVLLRWPIFADSEAWLCWGGHIAGQQGFGFHLVGTRVFLHSSGVNCVTEIDTGLDINNLFPWLLEARLYDKQSIEFYYSHEGDPELHHQATKETCTWLGDCWSPSYELISPTNANDRMTLYLSQTMTPTWAMN